MLRRTLWMICLAVWPLAVWADLYQPAPGTPERAAIMDAARVPIGVAIGLPVIFVVSVLNSDARFAYLQATPHNPDGTPINWNATRMARDWEQGVMSDTAMVLLEHRNRNWVVLDWVMGPTDVYWIG